MVPYMLPVHDGCVFHTLVFQLLSRAQSVARLFQKQEKLEMEQAGQMILVAHILLGSQKRGNRTVYSINCFPLYSV